jgi:hypothetical protein
MEWRHYQNIFKMSHLSISPLYNIRTNNIEKKESSSSSSNKENKERTKSGRASARKKEQVLFYR